MVRTLFLASLILLSLPFLGKAADYAIAAIVNNAIISNYDLSDRINLAIQSTGMENTQEVQQKLLPQVLQIMINEKLQVQEAEALDITFSDSDMQKAIHDLEKQNSLPEGGFSDFVRKLNVSQNAVIEQIRAQIQWQRVIAKKIAPFVTISEVEVREAKARKQQTREEPEANISLIALNTTNPSREREVKDLAHNLATSSRESNNFASLAKQFSQGPAAPEGGKIGWVKLHEVSKEIRAAVERLKPGDVSDPFKTEEGYMIVKLHEIRNVDSSPITPRTDEDIRRILRMKKIEREAQGYLQKLREQAFIEVRF